ncbi:MAG: hypothetical protein ABI564_02150 [Ideonella sp.]
MRNEADAAPAGRYGWTPKLQSDPSIRFLMAFAAFVVAVIILTCFYVVIQQGVTRGHAQWAKASRVMVSQCDSVGRADAGDNCRPPTTSFKVRQVSFVQ